MTSRKYVGKCGHVFSGMEIAEKIRKEIKKDENYSHGFRCFTCNRLWTVEKEYKDEAVDKEDSMILPDFSQFIFPIELLGEIFGFFASKPKEVTISFLICNSLTKYLREEWWLDCELWCGVRVRINRISSRIILPKSPQPWVRKLIIEGDSRSFFKLSYFFPKLESLQILSTFEMEKNSKFLEDLSNIRKLDIRKPLDCNLGLILSAMKDLEFLSCDQKSVENLEIELPKLKIIKLYNPYYQKNKPILRLKIPENTKIYYNQKKKNDEGTLSITGESKMRNVGLGVDYVRILCYFCRNSVFGCCQVCDGREGDSQTCILGVTIRDLNNDLEEEKDDGDDDEYQNHCFAFHNHCLSRWISRKYKCPMSNESNFIISNYGIYDLKNELKE